MEQVTNPFHLQMCMVGCNIFMSRKILGWKEWWICHGSQVVKKVWKLSCNNHKFIKILWWKQCLSVLAMMLWCNEDNACVIGLVWDWRVVGEGGIVECHVGWMLLKLLQQMRLEHWCRKWWETCFRLQQDRTKFCAKAMDGHRVQGNM
jgi:hypothetical protein